MPPKGKDPETAYSMREPWKIKIAFIFLSICV
jgi:hypothetical protein